MKKEDLLYQYLLSIGDNALILGQRLGELCGHGPMLETDIALTNISLDLLGQVRNYFQYAATVKGETDEDAIAFLRTERKYLNCQLVEQENTNFAHVIVRQFLFDSFHILLLHDLRNSSDTQLKGIAEKSIKEVQYHLRFSSEWLKRLGGGTDESNEKMQEALVHLYPYAKGLFEQMPYDTYVTEQGVANPLKAIEPVYYKNIHALIEEAELNIPTDSFAYTGGKKGIHTEQFGYILSDLQYMQRTYPNMQW